MVDEALKSVKAIHVNGPRISAVISLRRGFLLLAGE
jgi:hypothetical protein